VAVYKEVRWERSGRLFKIRPGSWVVVSEPDPGWYKIENWHLVGDRGVKSSYRRATEGYVKAFDWDTQRATEMTLYDRVD